MAHTTWLVVTIALAVFIHAQSAPAQSDDLQSKIDLLQEQLNAIQSTLGKRPDIGEPSSKDPVEILQRKTRYMSFQPMKRMVSWQPMKRGTDYSKEQIIRAIEEQLSEVLRAGETLGVNADEVLAHIRQRNAGLV